MNKSNLNTIISFKDNLDKGKIQEFAQKYLNININENINSEQYGDYKLELISLLKWDGENTENSRNLHKYIYDNMPNKKVNIVKEFDKDIPKKYIDSFRGEIIAIYVPTIESTKEWIPENSPKDLVKTTYKNKKIPILVDNKIINKFYSKFSKEQKDILNTIEKEVTNENNIKEAVRKYKNYCKTYQRDKTNILNLNLFFGNKYKNKLDEIEGKKFLEEIFELNKIDKNTNDKEYKMIKEKIKESYYNIENKLKYTKNGYINIRYFQYDTDKDKSNLKRKAEYILNNSEYQGLITGYVIENEKLGTTFFINKQHKNFKYHEKWIENSYQIISEEIKYENSLGI